MFSLVVLDGDVVCGVDQVDEWCSGWDHREGNGGLRGKSLWIFIILAVGVRLIFSPTFFEVDPC
jgi:hypothetical protein